jgi:hypothetical protein
MANAGAARGQPVVMATQEIHYASMAQVVEPSSTDSLVTREPKKLQSTVDCQALFVPSVWMTNFHRQRLGRACNWLNLIKLTVPAMIRLRPPHPQPDPPLCLCYHRDILSLISLDLDAIITKFYWKTWGFLAYPEDYDEQTNPFDLLMKSVLLEGIIPLAAAHFASFFSAYGVAQHVYCQRFHEFVEGQLKNFAGSWRLIERLIAIRIQGMQVEVLFYPLRQYPHAWEVVELSSLEVCPRFGPHERHGLGPSEFFFE